MTANENNNSTPIEKNDLVGLNRDVDENLTEGLVGRVVECNEDAFDVKFPLPGDKEVSAKLPREDIDFLVGTKQLENKNEN
ncbi:hypothetical protein [Brasilonema bromeliae]|uniref:DUF4926 domain-containing protein n=1 Tax=Brasilonema bromeliae SPC951 TaxID=385972 RepID=A0ABX1PCC8_9CYAN|nr:hypothetical protein [Brasilonema bromeliae]NMG22134.1 hypothetical protein [Brasilonema bromeliae SPC951]